MPTMQQIQAAIQNAQAAGDTAAVQRLTAALSLAIDAPDARVNQSQSQSPNTLWQEALFLADAECLDPANRMMVETGRLH